MNLQPIKAHPVYRKARWMSDLRSLRILSRRNLFRYQLFRSPDVQATPP